MGIAAGAAVAGKMLGGTQHTAVGQSFDYLRNHTGNQLGIGTEAAILDHGIVLVGQHVGDRGEVDVEAQGGEILCLGGADVVGFLGVALFTVNGHIVKLGGAQRISCPGDGAAFFIHADEQSASRGALRKALDILDHLGGLIGGNQVGAEIDDTAHRPLLNGGLGGVAALGHTGIAGEGFRGDEQHLADLFFQCHIPEHHPGAGGACIGLGCITDGRNGRGGRFFRRIDGIDGIYGTVSGNGLLLQCGAGCCGQIGKVLAGGGCGLLCLRLSQVVVAALKEQCSACGDGTDDNHHQQNRNENSFSHEYLRKIKKSCSYSIAHSGVFFYIQSIFSLFFYEKSAPEQIRRKNHVSFDKIHGSITQRRKTMI